MVAQPETWIDDNQALVTRRAIQPTLRCAEESALTFRNAREQAQCHQQTLIVSPRSDAQQVANAEGEEKARRNREGQGRNKAHLASA
jgi:hypothetical protein